MKDLLLCVVLQCSVAATCSCPVGSWATKLQQPRSSSGSELLFSDSCVFKTVCSFDSSADATLCFWLSEVQQNYSTAESDCKDKGSHLLPLKTKERASQFFKVIKPLKEKFWIGLNDLVEEDVFRWADDRSALTRGMRDILFPPDQPNNLHNEDCVEYNPERYPCNDDRCESKKRYVCEVTPGFRC